MCAPWQSSKQSEVLWLSVLGFRRFAFEIVNKVHGEEEKKHVATTLGAAFSFGEGAVKEVLQDFSSPVHFWSLFCTPSVCSKEDDDEQQRFFLQVTSKACIKIRMRSIQASSSPQQRKGLSKKRKAVLTIKDCPLIMLFSMGPKIDSRFWCCRHRQQLHYYPAKT